MKRAATFLCLCLLGYTAVLGCGAEAPAPYWSASAENAPLMNDVSADLRALLERERIDGACDRYAAGERDRETVLACGKWMFFYDSLGTVGLPTGLVDFLLDRYRAEIGPGFERLGMVADPTSEQAYPIGLAPGLPLPGGVPTLAYTCASCHFARLPDGRYAVGAANHAYDYGLQILLVAVLPSLLLGAPEDSFDPAAISRLRPFIDKAQTDETVRPALLESLGPIVDAGVPAIGLSVDSQRYYATWPTGTQDFLLEPVPIDDGVHTISKISALFGIPDTAELERYGLDHAMLGWTGSTRSLMDFLNGFVTLGVGREQPRRDGALFPLEQYILTLRAPDNPDEMDPNQVRRGTNLFETSGCVDCHDGPMGSGRRLFSYEEIGTDDALRGWGAESFERDGSNRTERLKSPRLVGTWTMSRFLHNGSVDSLESLFCLDDPRGGITEHGYGDAGHAFTCELERDDKLALIAFLRAH